MVINPAVRTKLGGDYPLSDDQVSELMDVQVKASAAVKLRATSTFRHDLL